jgi:hypothetical protein
MTKLFANLMLAALILYGSAFAWVMQREARNTAPARVIPTVQEPAPLSVGCTKGAEWPKCYIDEEVAHVDQP